MRNAVLAVAMLVALLGAANAQEEHVFAFLRTGGVELMVDSVLIENASGREAIVTRGFGGRAEEEDSFDFGPMEWPDAVTIFFQADRQPMEPQEIRPVERGAWVELRLGLDAPSEIMFDVRVPGVAENRAGRISRTTLSTVVNPSREYVNLKCNMGAAGLATIEIYDGTGQLVTTLFNGRLSAGPHNFSWNRTRTDGRLVSGGIYLARLSTASSRSMVKLIITD